MTKGLEIRAQIDTETTRGLIQINGGGAVAALTLLSSVLNSGKNLQLATPLVFAVVVFASGLGLAVIHNQFRRQCSLHHEHYNYKPPKGKLFGIDYGRPRVCFYSRVSMWASTLVFFAGVIGSAIGMIGNLDSIQPSLNSSMLTIAWTNWA